MKFRLYKSISYILIFAMLSLTAFSAVASASSVSCVEDHFSRLHVKYEYDGETTVRIPRTPPSENTCPYVAMSMLLTFYDTYWNKWFVEEKYEWQKGTYDSSTRTLTETFAATTEAKDWEDYVKDNVPEEENDKRDEYYPEYAQNHFETTNVFLEPYLISVGVELGFHNDVYDDVNNDGNNNEEKPTLGLTDEETVDVLERYLYVERGFTSDQVKVRYLHENDGNIVAKMKEIIESGFPVIYIGKRIVDEEESESSGDSEKKKAGHELIAYGIEKGEDGKYDILLHTGWKYDSYRKYNTVEYNLNRAIIWLEINKGNLSHECDYNYYDVSEDRYMCACNIYYGDTNLSHTHYYLTEYGYNSAFHYKECICGNKIENASHEFIYSNITSYTHTKKCSCGYETTVMHDYSEYNYNSSSHTLICDCGHTTENESHEFSYSNITSNTHTKTCYCGHTTGNVPHELSYSDITSDIHTQKCSCGYEETVAHDYNEYNYNSSTHTAVCACGHSTNEEISHSRGYCRMSDDFYHTIFCECGFVLGTERHEWVRSGLFYVCNSCGLKQSIGDGPILMKIDDENEKE